jgi:hypothetical protein
MKGKLSPGNIGYVCCIIDILYKKKSMKALTKTSFFIGIALLGITSLHAQTADDIVQKYITAVGGKDAIAAVKSLVTETTMQVMGTDVPSTTTVLVGKGYKNEFELNGTKMVQCYNTNGGWILNAMMGAPTPTALPAEMAKAGLLQLQVDPLANYAANGYKIELVGHDSADYKIHMTGSGVDATYYINMKTWLSDKVVTKVSANGQDTETSITFSDYRKTDFGVMFPFAMTLDLPQISISIAVKKVTANSTIDPAIFDMPKK